MKKANKVVAFISGVIGYSVFYHVNQSIGEFRVSTLVASALVAIGLAMMGNAANRVMNAYYERKFYERVGEAVKRGNKIAYRRNGNLVQYIERIGEYNSRVGGSEEE